MTLFADTMMIASRMDAFEPKRVGPSRQVADGWRGRLRRWFASGGR